MFGKSLAEYVRFQRNVLLLIGLVWSVRLGLSLAGTPVGVAKFVSITAVLVATALYYPWALHESGFGSYKELYVLALIQGVYSQTLVAAAIVLGIITGEDNIYTIPEFYPPSKGGSSLPVDGKNFGHAGAHILIAGAIFIPLAVWLLGSIVLFVLRKASPRPARA
jgi:hypothetical protein